MRPRGAIGTGIVSIALALTVGAIVSPSAFAERSSLAQITGTPEPFTTPYGVAVDSVDNLWVVDADGHGYVDKFDSSGNFIFQEDGDGQWDGNILRTLGVSDSNQLYVSDGSLSTVTVFDNAGNFLEHWPIDSGQIFLTVDNSDTPSNGKVFVATTFALYAFTSDGEPADFTGSADYIEDNRLLGTPDHEFFGLRGVSTDRHGNIYVVAENQNAVLKFDPNGIFIQQFEGTPAGPFGGLPGGIAIDPTTDTVLIVDEGQGVVHEFESSGEFIGDIDGSDTPAGSFSSPYGVAVDSKGAAYISDRGNRVVHKFSAEPIRPKVTYSPPTDPGQTSVTLHAHVDPNGGGNIVECTVEYGTTTAYGNTEPCSPSIPPDYSGPTDVEAELTGLIPESTYQYRVVARNANTTRKGTNQSVTPHWVTGLKTDPATEVGPLSATLNGSWVGNGDQTSYYFEWGTTFTYGNVTAVPPGEDGGAALGDVAVEFDLGGLNPVTTYHYRLIGTNSDGISIGNDQEFTTEPSAPLIDRWVSDAHSDSARLNAAINPGGEQTEYRFEWGLTDAYGESTPIPDADVGSDNSYHHVSALLEGLSAGETYHYRVVAENAIDQTATEDRTFATFPFVDLSSDPCPNVLERKQSGASLLLDCRAYELASDSFAGGYDVESDLIPGQAPLGGYPLATDPPRLLYSVHFGGIPGSGKPTNLGLDPYIATRGEDGWDTKYVGIPADQNPTSGPFGSPLSLADSSLGTFAFGGPDICAPCFSDGKTGIPLRLPDGSLVQGMAGSLDPGPGAEPDGYVAKQLSADGSQLIFSSSSQFEPDGNAGGDVSIYKRDLSSGTTQVISKSPAGTNLGCPQGAGTCHGPTNPDGIAALDVSSDGARTIVAQRIATDSAGNDRWHPYMHVGAATTTIDLAPTTTSGVLFAGMSADGTEVYFTTKDALLPADIDTSADLYRAEVSSSSSDLALVSTGELGAGQSDSCDPAQNEEETNWNALGSPSADDCSVLAIAGGGGVASESAAVFFLSPERLDGPSNGAQDKPNLYLAEPGSPPQFITTLEPDNPLIHHSLTDAEVRRTAEFQLTPDGKYAAFPSTLALTGYDNDAHTEVYRYATDSQSIDCASCAPTEIRATGDARLALNGNSLTLNGRVFFSTTEPLAARDLNSKLDAYEWSDLDLPEGEVQLISTGRSLFGSGLHSASLDGKDVFFFTRDTLVPGDANGLAMKIYDAREKGGFLFNPPPHPCKASDECHGPGTQAAPHPNIGTFKGTGGNTPATAAKKCKSGKVKKRGKCVRKKQRRRAAKRGSRRHA